MDIRRKPRERSTIWPYLLLLPALIVMLSVVIVPIINAVSMSFQSYNLTRPKKIGFIGLQNYVTLFHDPQFWSSLLRTVIWVIFGVGCQFLFGFLLALVLNKQFKGRGVVRAVSLIPWVTPGVLIALMWRWMYDGNYGVINDILMRLGLIHENIAFLSKPATAMPSVIVTIVWQGIPFFALMLLAGLQGISYDLYEAASIDGATGWQKLIYVTIPSLRNTIFVTTMLRIIWVANSGRHIQHDRGRPGLRHPDAERLHLQEGQRPGHGLCQRHGHHADAGAAAGGDSLPAQHIPGSGGLSV